MMIGVQKVNIEANAPTVKKTYTPTILTGQVIPTTPTITFYHYMKIVWDRGEIALYTRTKFTYNYSC